MEALEVNTDEEFVVKMEDLDKDDDLLNLSKELENTEFEDTVDLSEFLSNSIDIFRKVSN